MNHSHRVLGLALALGLAACKGPPPDPSTAATVPADTAAPAKDTLAMDNAPAPSTLTPPPHGEALEAIYDAKGDGSDAYPIQNGATAHFWHEQQYQIGGKRYYTAFAYATKERFGDDADADPAPDERVTLSQATYEYQDGHWQLLGAEPAIGEFGGNGKGDPVDPGALVQVDAKDGGPYVIAVPSSTLVPGGVQARAFQLLARDVEGRWRYLGDVAAGEDNAAGCSADGGKDGLPACVKSTGRLAFNAAGTGLPGIEVSFVGQDIDGPGQVRTLGPADTVRYTVDGTTGRYTAVR